MWFVHVHFGNTKRDSRDRKKLFFRALRARFLTGAPRPSGSQCAQSARGGRHSLRQSCHPTHRSVAVRDASPPTSAHFSSSALGESPNCHFAFAGETAGFCPHHFMYASRRAKTDVARSSLTKFMRVEIHLQHTIVCGSSCNHHLLSPRLLYQFKGGYHLSEHRSAS